MPVEAFEDGALRIRASPPASSTPPLMNEMVEITPDDWASLFSCWAGSVASQPDAHATLASDHFDPALRPKIVPSPNPTTPTPAVM